ncbi:MAG: VanW family protein [Clostridia bacterium]|nr:VanW family protein [Clostridia bacterium]
MQSDQPPRQRRSQRHGDGEAPRRPQYPDDAPRAAYPQYPNSASGQSAPQYTRQPYYQQPQYQQPPYQQTYAPRFDQNRPQGAPPVYGQPVYDGGYGDDLTPPRRRAEWPWLAVIILCVALLVMGAFIVSSLSSGEAAFRQKAQALDTNTFYDGVHVDGIHIGGLTMEEARAALRQSAVSSDQALNIKVTIDGKTWYITQSELPLSSNIDAVLEEAFSIGRQNTLEIQQSGMTPFAYRSQQVRDINQNGAFLFTEVTYDKATARQLAETLSARVYVAAQNATVYSFDFSTRSFQFQAEQYGAALDAEEIYSAITARMDARDYNGAIALSTRKTQPAVTVAQLQKSFGLLSTYTTTTLAGYNRNVNIQLACAAVNGTMVESGQTFSFNETTGRREMIKGYLQAGAIAQGESIEDYGGGVCQVSSTLFNAAILANMKIVKSSPHAWPSSYVEPGRDATVDWQSWQSLSDSVDFRFTNTSDYPIFLVAYLTGSNLNKACQCTVEIYGVALADGISIGIETRLVQTLPMPTPAPMKTAAATDKHPAGTSAVTTKGREGYVYETYRVFYQNGQAVHSELIRKSTYKAYAEQTTYYTD